MPTVPDIHQRGTRAAQPAANTVTVGTLYFVTGENVTERSTGTAWESYSGPAAGGAPGAHATTHETGGSDVITALAASVLTSGTLASARLATPHKTRSLTFALSNGTSDLVAGTTTTPVSSLYTGTITGARVLSAQTGSIVLDVWKDTYANYPPTVADTITAAAKPTLSSTNKAEDTSLTGWTTSVMAGDVFLVTVDSCTGIHSCALQLTLVLA